MRQPRKLHGLFAGLLLASVAACGGDDDDMDAGVTDAGPVDTGPADTGSSATLVSIAITPNPVMVEVGATQQLTVTGTFDDNTTSDQTASASFSSSASNVAPIGPSGVVTGGAEGTAVITADVMGVTATVPVTVAPMMTTGPQTLPMTVDAAFTGRAAFGPDGPPLHTEDTMCPSRAGGMNGDCHRFQWDGTGGAFTGAFWISGSSFADLTPVEVEAGATEITFWAWGETGGEVIEFGAGLNNADLMEAASVRSFITLSSTPTQYTVSLDRFGAYTEVRGAFLVAIGADRNPTGATVYVDDIQWTMNNSMPMELPLPMTVDANFQGRAGFGPDGPPLHTEDTMCPMRAGGMNGDCHRVQWDGTGGGFTGAFWVDGTGFMDARARAIAAGATEITFWAWGASGGEIVEVGAGFNNADEMASVRDNVTLTTTPAQYTVSLANFGPTTGVRGAFIFALNNMANPSGATIYIDDIQWTMGNSMPVELPLPMTVDANFSGRAGFGPAGPPLHMEDNMCPSRAGGMNGDCHRFQWDGTGGGFTGTFWVDGTSFMDARARAIQAGATEISFYAWGATGGETIEVGAGFGNADEMASVRENITITTTPTQYTVPLAAFGPTDAVRGAFIFAMNNMANPSGGTVYIDDIQWTMGNTMPMELPLPMTVDANFSGRAGFGPNGPPLHTEDNMCPQRAGGMNGDCHRLQWDGMGGGFTGHFWVDGTSFMNARARAIAAGATQISFWAWGAAGGETVEVGAGFGNATEPASVRTNVTLTTTPTQYTVDLSTFGPTNAVQGAFIFALNNTANPSGATIYIDDIQWVQGQTMPMELPLPMVVDQNFSGRAGFGPNGPPLHMEDNMCPTRPMGAAGDCHRFQWDGMGGGFTGTFWVDGTSFMTARGRAIQAGATEISFYAWGANGGEVLEAGAGFGNATEMASVREVFTLTNTPTRYFVRLNNFGPTNSVYGAFIMALATAGNPNGATVYIDDIQWTQGQAPTGVPLPMVVDSNYPDRSGFGPAGPPLHTEDTMCPTRAGGMNGDCHRFQWNGSGGGFTGTFWTVGSSFMNLQPVLIAPGATELSFWAWGASGGEVIEFGAGLNNPTEMVNVRQVITLTSTPTQYNIPLTAFGNYGNVYAPMLVVIALANNPMGATFYVDDIQWTNTPPATSLRPHPDDRVISYNAGTPALRAADIGGATVGDAEGGTVYVIPFQLPSIPSGGFTEANLEIEVLSTGGANMNALNADLYGLPFRTQANAMTNGVVDTGMFHADSAPDTSATLIADNFLVPTVGNGVQVTTGAAADMAIVNYLNAQVTAGAVAGDFVYLRLSPDLPAPIGAATTWVVGSAVNAMGPPNRPTLTVR